MFRVQPACGIDFLCHSARDVAHLLADIVASSARSEGQELRAQIESRLSLTARIGQPLTIIARSQRHVSPRHVAERSITVPRSDRSTLPISQVATSATRGRALLGSRAQCGILALFGSSLQQGSPPNGRPGGRRSQPGGTRYFRLANSLLFACYRRLNWLIR